ncbi:MAG: MFS transporter [Pseudonocardiales bacterium]|nr:MAG: MFS transporter [Pseudonocardiales bacterium]
MARVVQDERVKRPASPSGAGHSGALGRRRTRRGRRWVPDDHRAGPGRTDPPQPAAPPPSPWAPPAPSGATAADERNWSPPGASAHHPWDDQEDGSPAPRDRPLPPPRKITVTRVAAWRSRQLVGDGVRRFHRATTADGAGRSGLSSLTYAAMMDYAASAAIAVALANTLFFAVATAQSRTNVALYLLITVAPFAVVAPVVGPLLDRLQHGRRVAMALSFAGRGFLLIVMAAHVHDWLLYPAALGFMVLAKSYGVLQAAVIPRVLPPEITLVKTNSRLTAFGLVAAGVSGAAAAGVAALTGSPGALLFTAAICLTGGALCLRIPSWVEVTEGEIPASLRTESGDALGSVRRRQPMGRQVVVALWGNGTARLLTGFLTLFVAFAVKAQTEGSPGRQLVLLGIVGAAAGAGSFLGNGVGARMHFGRPDQAIVGCVVAGLTMAVLTALVSGIAVAAVTALVAATGSAVAKVCLDAVIQRRVPEESRASAFGRSETVLQTAWVMGGALGVLLPPTYWIGFASVSALLSLGLAQTVLIRRGASLIPGSRRRGSSLGLSGARSPR